jgi:hypothetical protein
MNAWWVQNRAAFVLDQLQEIRDFSLGVIAGHGVVDPFALLFQDVHDRQR